jgi:hypothetical protein
MEQKKVIQLGISIIRAMEIINKSRAIQAVVVVAAAEISN